MNYTLTELAALISFKARLADIDIVQLHGFERAIVEIIYVAKMLLAISVTKVMKLPPPPEPPPERDASANTARPRGAHGSYKRATALMPANTGWLRRVASEGVVSRVMFYRVTLAE